MNYEESVRALLALGRELAVPRQARVQKFGLENITVLAGGLGNPQRTIPCVHVAGTNGKGSTAAMLESILRAAGLRTGLYTSPHLERINERIRICGTEISDDEFAGLWNRIHETIERLLASGMLHAHPTFFECTTAMAFLAFSAEAVDMAAYEVGLGGRLDATNIVRPEVAIITPIDFDHESFLGHSIQEIASEKAGIIKPGTRVVSSVERREAREVISRRCEEASARLVEIDAAWELRDVSLSEGCYRAVARSAAFRREILLEPSLPGRFQLRNALAAATAALLLEEGGFSIGNASIARAIATARWPGRLERVAERPAIYIDGTHNPAGARELVRFWQENFQGRRIHLVYGAMRDKAVDEVAGLLFPHAETVVFTEVRQPRAISAALLADMTSDFAKRHSVICDPEDALEHALRLAQPEDAIFVTGSLYLAGELRQHWANITIPEKFA